MLLEKSTEMPGFSWHLSTSAFCILKVGGWHDHPKVLQMPPVRKLLTRGWVAKESMTCERLSSSECCENRATLFEHFSTLQSYDSLRIAWLGTKKKKTNAENSMCTFSRSQKNCCTFPSSVKRYRVGSSPPGKMYFPTLAENVAWPGQFPVGSANHIVPKISFLNIPEFVGSLDLGKPRAFLGHTCSCHSLWFRRFHIHLE